MAVFRMNMNVYRMKRAANTATKSFQWPIKTLRLAAQQVSGMDVKFREPPFLDPSYEILSLGRNYYCVFTTPSTSDLPTTAEIFPAKICVPIPMWK
eukprot:scaffold7612_cov76-Skeletonema_marinoi.AAC.1